MKLLAKSANGNSSFVVADPEIITLDKDERFVALATIIENENNDIDASYQSQYLIKGKLVLFALSS